MPWPISVSGTAVALGAPGQHVGHDSGVQHASGSATFRAQAWSQDDSPGAEPVQLKTGLMQRWLVGVSYLVALGLLIAGDDSMWLTLAFPAWVLVVSVLILLRSGFIDDQRATQA